MKRWLITGGFLALCAGLFLIFAQGFGRDVRAVPFGMKGKDAPAFTLRDLRDGKPVSLADFKGKPVIINFWASWCGPCKYEHPVLEWGAHQFGEEVQFLGMVFEDTEENARRWLGGSSGFPQLIDPNSLTAVKYGAAGVPETYFITRDGKIADRHVGPVSPDILTARVRALVDGTAGAPSAPSAQEAQP